jgi:peroxiredoxin/predicted 2-oxoglutarate/Fe(II)-dependent dioxygenase YbiX
MALLSAGDPAPWFIAPSTSNPNYHFDTVGGYRIILFFFGSTSLESAAAAVQDFCQMQTQFAALETPFFGISIDPRDQFLEEVILDPTFCKFIWDFECKVSQQYGVCSAAAAQTQVAQTAIEYKPTAFVLDENLRVLRVFPLHQADGYAAEVFSYISSLPKPEPPSPARRQAPVLFIPRVLEPEFCQSLIALHEASQPSDSGFMREVDGKTVQILDYGFKKRRDINLADTPLLDPMNEIVIRRIKPEIEKAFQFTITRFERHIVACYDAANQGFFNRHRDNTTKGTAHRRFAMSLNLNTGDYAGGCLRFPEYGSQLYSPDAGEAVIFSCSLLHEVTPVTQGRRYALLSFFYSDEDAALRERNRQFLAAASSDQADAPTAQSANSAEVASSTAKMPSGFQPKSAKKRPRHS